MTPEPYRELENYFFQIVNTSQPKELTMLDAIKAKLKDLWTHSWVFVSAEELKKPEELEDYWSFYSRTAGFTMDGQYHSPKEDYIGGLQDGTWMEQLDQILDVMGKHYGYNIKEQVYYSVHFPLNIEGEAGYGRSLNDEVFQKLLLSFPEVYECKAQEWLVKE